MLNYDKLIVDTSNIFYRVAAFYLKNLTQEGADSLMKQNTVFNHYKASILSLKQQTLGKVILLFDPLLSNGQMSERLKIKEGYKANRDRNDPQNLLRIDTLTKLYETFVIEPNGIDVYHDCHYEADDYVEKLTEKGKCLLLTSDEDFCRYLEEGRVEMLTQGLSLKEESLFTTKDFEKKYGFKPNITSVVFWKAIYGDTSDNIVGSFKNESTKVLTNASNEMKRLLVQMGESDEPLETWKREFFEGSERFTTLKNFLLLSNTAKSYEKLLDLTEDNFRVIESLLPRNSDVDVNKFKIEVDLKPKKVVAKKFSLGGLKAR